MGEWVAINTWQTPERSIRRRSFKNSIWREGDSADFRFVKNKDALAPAALLEEPQKAFAVRMREEIRRGGADIKGRGIEVARDRKETFRAKEPATGDFRQPGGAQRARELSPHRLERARMIDGPIALPPASLVIACQCRNAFQQRRFSSAVFRR